ncbi:glycosyltransferase family 4 protein [Paraburkholderia sacchari]|uniref:Glycosyltransferase family 4 protein n=1 Tax=Paraburkholderia sacchari TaxID=159450 RepID=A0A8T6ZBM8_9BURK|nr:glycosyltransferase family 4 protein [Paraburkholderia sacchari]NLP62043.1 glycosyltransferase family 4 protein [Paraburkholderia sacchari]
MLHIGPDREARGGIASVLRVMGESSALFENVGVELRFVGTTLSGGRSLLPKAMVFLRAIWCLVIALARSEIDIVHIHSALKGSLVRKTLFAGICCLFRKRYVFQIHNGGFFERYSKMAGTSRLIVRLALRRAERVIVLSDHMRERAVEGGILSADRCAIVYNGIADPLHGHVPLMRRDHGAVRIVFLGLISEAKGIGSLLSAVENLADMTGEFFVTVYGTGEIASFEKELMSRRLNEVISYGGWIDGEEKQAVLASADIFVLPSRSEGFSVAVLEAMAHGLAIVSTAIPGIVDAVRNDIEAMLVAPDDAAALATAIRDLLGNSELRVKLGAAARRRYLECFTVEKMACDLSEIYTSCV